MCKVRKTGLATAFIDPDLEKQREKVITAQECLGQFLPRFNSQHERKSLGRFEVGTLQSKLVAYLERFILIM